LLGKLFALYWKIPS